MPVLILILAVYALKVYLVGSIFYVDDPDSYLNILLSDSAIIMLCVMLYVISGNFKWVVRGLLRSLSYLILLFYTGDMIVILYFQTRLYMEDIIHLFSDAHLLNAYSSWEITILAVILALVYIEFLVARAFRPGHSFWFVCGSLVWLAGSFYFNVDTSIRGVFFKNFIVINRDYSHFNQYSEGFVRDFNYQPIESCEGSEGNLPDNIYVFLVESWSNYHSELFGQQNNWTPQLDKLARENIALKSFYANGYTTEAGLYSLLTGLQPVLSQYKGIEKFGPGLATIDRLEAMPEVMEKAGYESYFFTSGDLGFLNKGEWLKGLRFSNLMGSKDFPEKERRFLFKSVEDKKLIEKVKEVLSGRHNKKFVVVENVSTHAPFYSPDEQGKIIRSESHAFSYTDRVLAEYITELKKGNNLIVVLSDHRAMTPVTESERAYDGLMAVSHVPHLLSGKTELRPLLVIWRLGD